MKNKSFCVAPGTILGLSMVFFAIPASVLLFSFSGVNFLKGEIWRIFTFPFVHTSITHLLENMGALLVTGLLAYLVGVRGKQFLLVFFGSSILLAFADIVLFPTLVVAGTSLGIYAVLGSISTKGTDFIPQHVLVPVLISAVFFKYVIHIIGSGEFTGIIFDQTLLHFFGFLAGILIFYILGLHKMKKRVLTAWKG